MAGSFLLRFRICFGIEAFSSQHSALSLMSITLRQGTLEMRFGLFELQVAHGWLLGEKIEHCRIAS
jgi:hypothetical protein